jgi:hypothetical protein
MWLPCLQPMGQEDLDELVDGLTDLLQPGQTLVLEPKVCWRWRRRHGAKLCTGRLQGRRNLGGFAGQLLQLGAWEGGLEAGTLDAARRMTLH